MFSRFTPLALTLSVAISAVVAQQVPILQPQSTDRTVYQILNEDSRFTRLMRAINASDTLISTLNSSSIGITFFAVPDWAIPKPDAQNIDAYIPETEWDLAHAFGLLEGYTPSTSSSDDKKERFRKLIQAILSYHIIPKALDASMLTDYITHPTNLSISDAMNGHPLRLRVEHTLLPPATTVNLYSKVIEANIEASNGFLHVINHPLLPPPSAFQELFMEPSKFSIFTSALQRTGLTDALDLRPVRKGDGVKFEGTSTVTIFAPMNRAFEALPKKLQLFLFSVHGGRALQKLLQYHITPDIALLSDSFLNETSRSTATEVLHPAMLTSESHIVAATLLEKHPLNITIVKRNITLPLPGPRQPHVVNRQLFVNDQSVYLSDIVALNGGVHVIDKLLDPRKDHQNSHCAPDGGNSCDVWANWEDWLPQWGQ
jgi:uncharacterized surface protein with fasciclin (FAS1) repeats